MAVLSLSFYPLSIILSPYFDYLASLYNCISLFDSVLTLCYENSEWKHPSKALNISSSLHARQLVIFPRRELFVDPLPEQKLVYVCI